MSDALTENNFLLYAAARYDNPQCVSTDEFYEDLKRFKYIKKLLTRYSETGELKERLVLNHLIVLGNTFGPLATCKMCLLKLKKQLHLIKPFLIELNMLPQVVSDVGEEGSRIYTDEISIDYGVVEALRRL